MAIADAGAFASSSQAERLARVDQHDLGVFERFDKDFRLAGHSDAITWLSLDPVHLYPSRGGDEILVAFARRGPCGGLSSSECRCGNLGVGPNGEGIVGFGRAARKNGKVLVVHSR